MLAILLSECEKGSSYYNTIEINVAENTITMLLSTLKAFDLYLKENVDLFRRMWTQFDIYSMCAGIFSAFLLLFISILGLKIDKLLELERALIISLSIE